MTSQQAARLTVRSAIAILLIALAAYPLDFAVWRIRVAFGGGMDQVEVTQLTSAALKGNKTEFYYDGRQTVDCSRSLFPQGGVEACWWQRRHPQQIQQY